jgi:hypothetical protein
MAELSDEARLYWPFLYAGSNGYGRFLLNYEKIIARCFPQFKEKPSQEAISRCLKEYKRSHLLFIYTAGAQKWAAWDSAAQQQHYSEEDRSSPRPPEPAFAEWIAIYRRKKANLREVVNDSLADEFESDGSAEISHSYAPFVIKTGETCIKTPEVVTEVYKTKEFIQVPPSSINTSIHQSSNTSSTSEASVTSTNIQEQPGAASEVGIEGWDELTEAAGRAQMCMDPDLASDLCQKFWRRLDFASRRAAVDGIRDRIENGQYQDPQFVPTLDKYLRGRRWKESLRPRGGLRPDPVDKFAHLRAIAANTERKAS